MISAAGGSAVALRVDHTVEEEVDRTILAAKTLIISATTHG
jgi:hypothetical protein